MSRADAGAIGGASKGQNGTCLESASEAIASQHGVSERTIKRDGQFAAAVESLRDVVPEQMTRKPECIHYAGCLDHYAGIMEPNGREHPGWSCEDCPRYQAEDCMDPNDAVKLYILGCLIIGQDPETVIEGKQCAARKQIARAE